MCEASIAISSWSSHAGMSATATFSVSTTSTVGSLANAPDGLPRALVERRHLARVHERQVVVVADDHRDLLDRTAARGRVAHDERVDAVRLVVGAGHLPA